MLRAAAAARHLRRHVATTSEAIRAVRLDPSGSLTPRDIDLATLRKTTGAPLRDLLNLDIGARTRHRQACVLPREKAVLIQLGGLTAVINADEALFFDAGTEDARPRAALRRIGASVEFAFQHHAAPAFELAVLEAVLSEVSSSFQRRRDLYEPVVQKQLREASCEFDGFGVDGLHRLSAFDGALMSFEAETRQTLQVLDELLASDEDMLGLLLSERLRAAEINPERHGVVELLLEAYHRRLASVVGDVAELRGKVAAATELGRVTIDLNRNNIIKFNLYLSMTAVGLAATTSIAGIFGMNLVSGVESAPLAFAAVTAGSGLVGAAVVAGFHATMRSQKSIQQRARHASDDREALTALLANMATVENVFDDACRDLTRPVIAERLEAATGRAPSEREVEILFDIFDASQNDKISLREARSALHRGDAHPLIT